MNSWVLIIKLFNLGLYKLVSMTDFMIGAKGTAFLVHCVSKFAHSFSFSPSSALYFWSDVGTSG